MNKTPESNNFLPPPWRDLAGELQEALERRLKEQPNYSESEIADITSLNTRLFPRDMRLSEEVVDRLRLLLAYAKIEFAPLSRITSHRPFVGPVIVFLKRLTFPLVALHMRPVLRAIQGFCEEIIEFVCLQQVEIERLRSGDGK